MIRINLLPIREFKKIAALKRQVAFFVVVNVAVMIILAVFYLSKDSAVGKLESKKQDLSIQEAALKKKVKEVARLAKEEKDVEIKLGVIDRLEAQRTGPIQILDALSRHIPVNKAWLVELNKRKDKMTLKGVSMDNETIADFIKNLMSPKDREVLLQTLEKLEAMLKDPDKIRRLSDLEALLKILKGLKELKSQTQDLITEIEGLSDIDELKARTYRIIDLIKHVRQGRKRNRFYFDNVELIKSTQEVRKEIRLKSFSVICRVVVIPEGQEEMAPKKKKAPRRRRR